MNEKLPTKQSIAKRLDQRAQPSDQQPGVKKAYCRPVLTSYGGLMELTLFNGSQVNDSGGSLRT